MMFCRHITIFFVMLFGIAVLPGHARSVDVDSILQVLDDEILRIDIYKAEKEHRLDSLKQQIRHDSHNIRQNYEMCSRLYEEYKKYQFDSNYTYATRMLEYANQM